MLENLLTLFLARIDQGFINIKGDTTFLLWMLMTISITFYGIWVALGEDGRTNSPLVRRFIAMSLIILAFENWQDITDMIQDAFARLGLQAAQADNTSFQGKMILSPDAIIQQGIDLVKMIIKSLSVYQHLFPSIDILLEIALSMLSLFFVFMAYVILAVQVIAAVIEFKLVSLAGMILVPFGTFFRLDALASNTFRYVLASGARVFTLAIIINIGFKIMENIVYAKLLSLMPIDDANTSVTDIAGAALQMQNEGGTPMMTTYILAISSLIFLTVALSSASIAGALASGKPVTDSRNVGQAGIFSAIAGRAVTAVPLTNVRRTVVDPVKSIARAASVRARR